MWHHILNIYFNFINISPSMSWSNITSFKRKFKNDFIVSCKVKNKLVNLFSDLLGNRPASRLAGLVYIYELYKSEPITLSPFAAVFVRALMPTTKSAEKSFITLLLTNSPLAKEAYRYCHKTQGFDSFYIFNEIIKYVEKLGPLWRNGFSLFSISLPIQHLNSSRWFCQSNS